MTTFVVIVIMTKTTTGVKHYVYICIHVDYESRHAPSPTVVGSMGREIDVDNLVGAAEIAERLNLSHPQNVHKMRSRAAGTEHPFPEPVVTLTKAMIWSWPEVRKWAKATGRKFIEPHEEQAD